MKHHHSAIDTSHAVSAKNAPHAEAKEAEAGAQNPARSDEYDGAVRQAAYSLYAARGYLDGNDLDDWLKAQAQVDQMLAQSAQSLPQRHRVIEG